MADYSDKTVGIKRREVLLKIIFGLPKDMQIELAPLQAQISEELDNFNESNQSETLESNQLINSYEHQTDQYIKQAKTEGLLSRRSFVQISSFLTATSMFEFFFSRKVHAQMLPFAFLKGTTPKNYVDDVFSICTYTGNGATQTITNGIDLLGKGGMVWSKGRSAVGNNVLSDSVNGASKRLFSNLTAAQDSFSSYTFNSNGYSFGGGGGDNNTNSVNYVSWTFRKAAKFFDIVTWSGNDEVSRVISHTLGQVPGMVIVKKTNAVSAWPVHHRAQTSAFLFGTALNTTEIYGTTQNSPITASTSATITLGNQTDASSNTAMNATGTTYVAYLFAHDISADGIIQCGSFTTDASANASVTLGWEPQFVLTKDIGAIDDWRVSDSLRGMVGTGAGSLTARLVPNTTGAENALTGDLKATAIGMTVSLNASRTYIYVAIRRPNKPPTLGTQVFDAIADNSMTTGKTLTYAFAPDAFLHVQRESASAIKWLSSRLTSKGAVTYATYSESSFGTVTENYGIGPSNAVGYPNAGGSGTNGVHYAFKRAPGFFDVVTYTGTSSYPRLINHNLSVAPELILIKDRNGSTGWYVYSKDLGNTKYLILHGQNSQLTDASIWNSTSHSAATFTAGNNVVNGAFDYVAYLFATKSGISKVGIYTGNGASQSINCGFSSGARFVLIKRTDSTGDWHVWDTVRGIVAGNDPHLLVNMITGEVTTDDSIDPDNSGFIVNQVAATDINVTSASYIFLAIA